MDGLIEDLRRIAMAAFVKLLTQQFYTKFIFVVCNVWYALGDIFLWYEAVILSFASKFTSSVANEFDALLISNI